MMDGTKSAALAAVLSAALAGCVGEEIDPMAETDSTEVFEVTPSNGVWDDEYGRTLDPTDCSFRFRVARRLDGVIVEASVLDDKIVTDDCVPGSLSCPGWDDDNIECFFDGDNDKSPDSRSGGTIYGGEYILVANRAAQSDNSSCPRSFGRDWTGTVNRVRLPNGKWKIDYSLWFSWKCLGLRAAPKPDEDVTFGFNVCVHDDDTGGRADRALYWKGNPALPYRDESKFGTITLKGRRTAPAPAGR